MVGMGAAQRRGQVGVARRSRWWQLPVVMVAAFAISATATSLVAATVGGDARTFVGDDEPNVVEGSDADDTMFGGGGDDHLEGLLGADVLDGEAGDDTLIGDVGAGSAEDRLTGGDGDDTLAGFGGDDTLDAGPGNDLVGSIDFTRAGGYATVEHGDDVIFGGLGDDVLLAGPGDDEVFGGDGWDHLRGDEGNDLLSPGTGDDFVEGDAGSDTISFAGLNGPVVVNLGQGSATGAGGTDEFVGIENVTGGAGPDTLIGDSSPNRLVGGKGADRIRGAGGGDVVDGGAGNDRIEARNGSKDTIDCGEDPNGAADVDVAVVDLVDTVRACERVYRPDTRAPQTTITSSPRGTIRTTRAQVRVSFGFRSSEPRSTFTCRVDRGPFRTCSSPRSVILDRGRHVFRVRARDAAGNVDPTPAAFEVVVQRLRRNR